MNRVNQRKSGGKPSFPTSNYSKSLNDSMDHLISKTELFPSHFTSSTYGSCSFTGGFCGFRSFMLSISTNSEKAIAK